MPGLVFRGHGSQRKKNSGKFRVHKAVREIMPARRLQQDRGTEPAREIEPGRKIEPGREIEPNRRMEAAFPANSTDGASVSQIAHISTPCRIFPYFN